MLIHHDERAGPPDWLKGVVVTDDLDPEPRPVRQRGQDDSTGEQFQGFGPEVAGSVPRPFGLARGPDSTQSGCLAKDPRAAL